MSTKYRITPVSAPKVAEMPSVTATQLKNASADVFDLLAKEHAVVVQRHDKPRAVILSVEQYEALTGKEDQLLNDLIEEYRVMLDDMQGPEQRAAGEAAFNATEEELGRVAMEGALRKVATGEIRL